MPRQLRIEQNGFYHVLNRGVDRQTVYHEREDFLKFLQILQETSDEYGFEIFSYCFMNNHYHLLLKTANENLSLIMQKINSRYSIYFNKKQNRVGPLWQGRFKSFYVYDENYLQTLARYIEFNPIKANIIRKIGEYEWSMSGRKNAEFSMLNFELIDMIDFSKDFGDKEEEKIDELFRKKIEIKDDKFACKELRPLEKYFEEFSKEVAIYKAIQDGYKQVQVARFLNLSSVSVSKTVKIYRQKVTLFNKLRDKGIFWSFDKDIRYKKVGEKITIEYLLKYGDFDDIILGLKLFGKRVVKKVWEEKMKSDKRFIRLNLMLARVFFGMDVEADYFKKVKNERFEKLRLLTS